MILQQNQNCYKVIAESSVTKGFCNNKKTCYKNKLSFATKYFDFKITKLLRKPIKEVKILSLCTTFCNNFMINCDNFFIRKTYQ